MRTEELAGQVGGVASLAEPVRRDLYLYVASQPDPVSRDQASAALDVPRHTAKFHLDRLVADGLLAVEFRRLTGRRGPGAGRPTKLYRRSGRQLEVSLPERHYDLAGQLMARAIEETAREGGDVVDAVLRKAAQRGTVIGEEVRAGLGHDAGHRQRLAATCEALADQGYEPRSTGDAVELANCPFHALAREHTDLVCGMNLALIGAAVSQVDPDGLTARLDPAPDRCCVVLSTTQQPDTPSEPA
jgi:predicted ArsR family transcriptional regulator